MAARAAISDPSNPPAPSAARKCRLMQSLKGQLLIASAQLTTPIFARAVILMLDHNDEGAIGVILNLPINTVITDLSGKIFDEDFEWNKPLHLGGPVPGSLTVLHTLEEFADQ